MVTIISGIILSLSQIIIKPSANSVKSAIVTKSGRRGSEMTSEYDRIVERHNETQYVGPVCKNCGHVIAFLGAVHCNELDCDCLKPEVLK